MRGVRCLNLVFIALGLAGTESAGRGRLAKRGGRWGWGIIRTRVKRGYHPVVIVPCLPQEVLPGDSTCHPCPIEHITWLSSYHLLYHLCASWRTEFVRLLTACKFDWRCQPVGLTRVGLTWIKHLYVQSGCLLIRYDIIVKLKACVYMSPFHFFSYFCDVVIHSNSLEGKED